MDNINGIEVLLPNIPKFDPSVLTNNCKSSWGKGAPLHINNLLNQVNTLESDQRSAAFRVPNFAGPVSTGSNEDIWIKGIAFDFVYRAGVARVGL